MSVVLGWTWRKRVILRFLKDITLRVAHCWVCGGRMGSQPWASSQACQSSKLSLSFPCRTSSLLQPAWTVRNGWVLTVQPVVAPENTVRAKYWEWSSGSSSQRSNAALLPQTHRLNKNLMWILFVEQQFSCRMGLSSTKTRVVSLSTD